MQIVQIRSLDLANSANKKRQIVQIRRAVELQLNLHENLSNIGHVFEPDHGAKRTDQRHCVNDSSIQYVKFDPPASTVEAGKLVLPQRE